MSASSTVWVEVTPPYPVEIGSGLLEQAPSRIEQQQVAVITDENVATRHLTPLQTALEAGGKRLLVLTVPPGEQSKTLERCAALQRRLAEARFDRSAAVVALGGGVVGDLAGFVAATYLRGVAFYNLPTSLLAMGDAAVGGKTGVNLPEGKNLVGAFWQPRAVFCDVRTLATLPPEQFREGAVELFKHGLLGAPRLLELLVSPDFRPAGDKTLLAEAVAASVAVKAQVVAGDEREAGARAHLNLGHTLAHALEAATHHQLSHGQAVAYGLVFAARLAANRGWRDLTAETVRFLRWVAPPPLEGLTFEALEPFLLRDKKVAAGKARFVLLRDLGKPQLVADVDRNEQLRAWRDLLEVTT